MKHLLYAVATLPVVTVLAMAPALAGNESRYRAFDLGDGSFEVVADFTENAIYWCGASIFARNTLGRPINQRIYVLQAPSPSRAQPGEVAVRFGLTPPASGAASSFTNDVSLVGNSLTVSQAKGGCTERSSSG